MPIKIYPVTKIAETCEDYQIKVNGEAVALDTARVSAAPFNRRWPGHQRPKDQSELINFLSLAMDEAVTFEITPAMPFEDVIIRPLSLGITPEIKDGTITFTLEKPAYFTVEPFGRNKALHIFADPMPCYDIRHNDPNVLYFGPGEHDAGVITLQSNQTLFLDEGAVVYACVRAIDAENISILGRGILDNSKNTAKILFECNAENNTTAIKNAIREHTVQIEYCTNVKIEGITIRDSLVYNIRPIGCKNLHIANVKIIGCWRYNSDGIDMHNCEDVFINNCFIRTFDDSICVKGFDCYQEGDIEKAVQAAMYRNGKSYDVFKNTVIRNCTVWNDWGKSLEIGAETKGKEIYDIVFENCDIIHVTGSVLDCYNVDYADVHDITYQNINVEYDNEIPKALIQNTDAEIYQNTDPNFAPRLMSVISAYHFEYSAGSTRRGTNRNIFFKNIHLFGRQRPKLFFKGCDETHLSKDVVVENLYWNGEPVTSFNDGEFVVSDFAENINYKFTAYDQMDKNTVNAANQLKQQGPVRFFNPEGKGKRIMFVGNSMTLHGINTEIGWPGEWGMAASSKENDYVHRLMSETDKLSHDCAYCICQVSEWERQYEKGESLYHLYESARDFNADIIVMRFVENCPKKTFDKPVFKTETVALLQYLNPSNAAQMIFTTGFWRHPADESIIELAEELNWPLVKLGDLGEKEEMKAIGLFAHTGVANHPGDLGMKNMADRIFKVLKNYL